MINEIQSHNWREYLPPNEPSQVNARRALNSYRGYFETVGQRMDSHFGLSARAAMLSR